MNKLRLIVGVLAVSLFSASPLHADDTEIFFSKADANESKNKQSANVMIMLDTSGSMQDCKTSKCKYNEKKRIDLLEEAMHILIDDVSPDIRLGLSRFRRGTMNDSVAEGGHVLVPVINLNENTRNFLKDEVSKLNDINGTGDPTGGTPTAKTYWETGLYMMGGTPYSGKYGTSTYYNDNTKSMCVEYGEFDVEGTCQDVFDGWSEWAELGDGASCNTALNTCKSETDGWAAVPSCDVSREDCRATSYGGWQQIGGACDASQETCQYVIGDWKNISGSCDTSVQDTCQFSGWSNFNDTSHSQQQCKDEGQTIDRRWDNGWFGYGATCEERIRSYQQRDVYYEERDVTGFEEGVTRHFSREGLYKEVCEKETRCVNDAKIVENGKYVSPMDMENQCESNHIVLFTDGEPSPTASVPSSSVLPAGSCKSYVNDKDYKCQEDISDYLSSEMNMKGRSIKTYNVALYLNDAAEKMEAVSTDGAEGTFVASTANELAGAFLEAINQIDESSRALSSPGVSVNQMNRFEHLNDLYYAVFTPNKYNAWQGNLKKYKLKNKQVVGQTGNAIDSDTGFFSENARSFWSGEVDGYDVEKGGARAEVKDRSLYYNNGTTVKKLEWDKVDKAGGVDKTFLGLSDDATDKQVSELIESLKKSWGDPLHSVPLIINYGSNENNNLIFVSTNGGMLHAIDTSDGAEKYAFMPEEFIGKANEFVDEEKSLTADNRRTLYGLDSSWVAWRKPNKTDPVAGAPEAVYLYGGMRRGGRSYYALDVSSKNSPKVKWSIKGGETSGFKKLGQTWSVPTLTQIMDGDKKVPVLVFGGGYSPEDHDLKQGQGRSSSGDDMGNAVYIVNAETGSLIWEGSDTNMKWSVPGSISAVDKNFDGVADFLYFGDLGGQLFRVDLGQSGEGEAKKFSADIHRLADVGSTQGSKNRRFYDAPAVAYMIEGGKKKLFVVAGSGYRSHPLDESVDDALFVIKDETAMQAKPGKPGDVSISDLINVSTADAEEDKGWYLPMEETGEKMLASPVIYPVVIDGEVVSILAATSYTPDLIENDENPCAVTYGQPANYTVGLLNGKGVDLNNDGETDPIKDLPPPGVIPPKPTLLFDPDPECEGPDCDKIIKCVGTDCEEAGTSPYNHLRKRRWLQLDKTEADMFKSSPDGEGE